MANANDNRFYCEYVTLTVDGVAYSVASLIFQSYENTFPSIRAVINPMSQGFGGKAAKLGDFLEVWSELSSKAMSKSCKAELVFDLVGASETQNVWITEWLLVSAGVEEVSAGGSFRTVVQLEHPVKAGDTACMSFFNSPKTVTYPGKMGDNVMEAWLKLFDAYLKGIGASVEDELPSPYVGGIPDPVVGLARMDQKLKDRLATARKAIEDNVEWKGEGAGFPFQSCVSNAPERVCAAIWASFSSQGGTPWQMFLGMMNSMFVGVYGGFDSGKLAVRPSEPWAAAKGIVMDKDIAAMQLPIASDPVSAVAVQGAKPLVPYSITVDGDVDNASEGQAWPDMRTIGAYTEMFDKVTGRVMPVELPRWLDTITSVDTYGDGAGNPVYDMVDLNSNPSTGYDPGVKSALTKSAGGAEKCANAFAKDVFCAVYGADSKLQVDTRVLIQHNGEFLMPGRPLSFGNPKGSTVRAYIFGVTHNLDCDGKSALTTLYGSHVSPIEMEPSTSEMFK
jgi:hypothetical protein